MASVAWYAMTYPSEWAPVTGHQRSAAKPQKQKI